MSTKSICFLYENLMKIILFLYSDLLKMMIDAAMPNMAHQNCLFIYLIETVVHTVSSESFTSKSGFKHHNVCIL